MSYLRSRRAAARPQRPADRAIRSVVERLEARQYMAYVWPTGDTGANEAGDAGAFIVGSGCLPKSSAPPDLVVALNWGGGDWDNPATPGADFDAPASVTLPSNGSIGDYWSYQSQTVSFTGKNDEIDEPVETVELTVDGTSAQGAIADDDDPAPTTAPDDSPEAENGLSDDPVRFYDGALVLETTDLESSGFGSSFGHTRSWSNKGAYHYDNRNGNGWTIHELPLLVRPGGATGAVGALTSATSMSWFDNTNGSSTAPVFGTRMFSQQKLAYADVDDGSGGKEYVLTDPGGNQTRFFGFDAALPLNKRGGFKSLRDAAGNRTAAHAWDVDGNVSEVRRTGTSGVVTTTESYLYAYLASGTNKGRLSNVTLRRSTDGGTTWQAVRQTDFTYYDGTGTGAMAFGNAGDLQTAVIKDGAGNALDHRYYRYFTSAGATGYKGGLAYEVGPESYARLAAALPTGTTPLTATDAQLAPYASKAFEYDSSKRVSKQVLQGWGTNLGGGDGRGTFTYAYSSSANADGYNSWKYKTVETLPDGNQNIVYSNYRGEAMLKVFKAGAVEWKTFFKYSDSGRIVWEAQPSAVTGYSESYPDLLNKNVYTGNYAYLADSAGLIEVTDYYAATTATGSTAGGVTSFVQNRKVQQGELGTAVLQESRTYLAPTYTPTVPAGVTAVSSTSYLDAAVTQYRNTDGTGGQTTSFAYTFVADGGGNATNRPQTVTATLPTVAAGQNGPGTAATEVLHFDKWGFLTWEKDADGYLTRRTFDLATAAATSLTRDANTAQTSDEPAGWSTPAGGGLHLTSTYEVDALGRTTKLTDPNGNVTYAVYNDPNHERRTYRGWQSGTNTTTGPIEVARQYRPVANAAAGQRTLYEEVLTSSATPAIAGGRPNGTETLDSSNIQSLARWLTNPAGQVVEVDAYFSLSGVTYSVAAASLGTSSNDSASGNYHATLLGYDPLRRTSRVQSPTGTITRTVFDGPGREASVWIGTDDTPASGAWSPSNNAGANMTKVLENQYDDGGIGNGNLTKLTALPGGGAANQITRFYNDWRDRLVAMKQGDEGGTGENADVNRQLGYFELDNLGQATAAEQYDADGLIVTSSGGVPVKPASTLRRARTETSFDEQGRGYRAKTFSVDQSTGALGDALQSDAWYDKRGNVIKSKDPSGLVTKNTYDGAARVSKRFFTDGGGDPAPGATSNWDHADDVTGDKVLEQSHNTYDANSNAILVTGKQRFHDETGTGELGNATTAPKARVSYAAAYYDAADRTVADVNVGTNGGSAYTRPGTAPARSDSVLVDSYAYNAAGWMDAATDPRGIVGKTEYDLLGRTTKTIEAYADGTPSDADDRITRYTYDGLDQIRTLTADLPSGQNDQTTEYAYGVTPAMNSDIYSNDLLAETRYPDKSTGLAGTADSDKDRYAYSALGQVTKMTDRNGSTHEYAHDALGRTLSDSVTVLGAGVDGAVRRLETAYDTAGRPYLFTSHSAATGGTVVNQVQRAFNGLGQMTAEYQEHAGAVNTGTSTKVQYGYDATAASGC